MSGIHFILPGSKRIFVAVEDFNSTTISELARSSLTAEELCDFGRTRFIFRGKLLSDHVSLNECGIKPGSKIMMVGTRTEKAESIEKVASGAENLEKKAPIQEIFIGPKTAPLLLILTFGSLKIHLRLHSVSTVGDIKSMVAATCSLRNPNVDPNVTLEKLNVASCGCLCSLAGHHIMNRDFLRIIVSGKDRSNDETVSFLFGTHTRLRGMLLFTESAHEHRDVVCDIADIEIQIEKITAQSARLLKSVVHRAVDGAEATLTLERLHQVVYSLRRSLLIAEDNKNLDNATRQAVQKHLAKLQSIGRNLGEIGRKLVYL